MKYCSHCGKEIADEAVICINCGCSVKGNVPVAQDDGEIEGGLMALSILVPLAGWILWGVKSKETPETAKKYGMAGIIAFIVYLFIILISSY